MVKDVQRLQPQLSRNALVKFGVLAERGIHIENVRAGEIAPLQRPQLAGPGLKKTCPGTASGPAKQRRGRRVQSPMLQRNMARGGHAELKKMLICDFVRLVLASLVPESSSRRNVPKPE